MVNVEFKERPRLHARCTSGHGTKPDSYPWRIAFKGVHLEVTRPPGHRRLDDLIADDEKSVSRAGRAEALRLPVGGLVGDGEVRHRRPAPFVSPSRPIMKLPIRL